MRRAGRADLNNLRDSKKAGVLASILSYVVAFGVAVAAVGLVRPGHPLLVIAVGDLAATVAVIAGYYLWTLDSSVGARQLLVAGLVFLYSLRLTTNFYRDWPGLSKEDFRYVRFRRRFSRFYRPVGFVGIHFFPTVMVYLGCLPLFGIMRGGDAPPGLLDAAGAAVMLGAILLALVADEQLRGFRADPANAGKGIERGLWKRSRHPNYLGEVWTWWGLYLFGLAAGLRWWWTGMGAAAITLMFVFVSIPMMEERAMETREGYQEYRERTPRLLPLRR